MRTGKKRYRVNTFVIRKSNIIFSLALIIFMVLLGVFSFKISFSQNTLKDILKSVIYFFPTNEYMHIDYIENQTQSFNKNFVLAESFPMIDTNYEKSESATEKNNVPAEPKEEKVEIPINTYPIAESNSSGKNLQIKNETTYQPDITSLLNAPLGFSSPEILIVHTHASESYKTDNLNYYREGDSDRNLDIKYNMVRVGEELAKELTNCGFKVTHAKDINDYPSYNQSYNKTLQVINYFLRVNPNIQIVIDLHRDSIVKSDGTKLKFTADIEGEKVAQIMIVCGTNQAGLENDTWQENLKFSLKLQNYMEKHFPSFARPLNLRQERFNTHATPGSMIIEVGTSGNTLNEALSSVKYLANAINETLKPYK